MKPEHETLAATGAESEDVPTPRLVLWRDAPRDLNTALNLDLPVRLSERLASKYGVVGFLATVERESQLSIRLLERLG